LILPSPAAGSESAADKRQQPAALKAANVPVRSTGDDSAGFLPFGETKVRPDPSKLPSMAMLITQTTFGIKTKVPFAPGILMQARRLASGAASLRFRHAEPMRVSRPTKGI
jgi:hypothetical protein